MGNTAMCVALFTFAAGYRRFQAFYFRAIDLENNLCNSHCGGIHLVTAFNLWIEPRYPLWSEIGEDKGGNTGLIMKYQDKMFSGKKIDLDFNEFIGCQFEDCEFIYHGAGRVEISGCEFTNVTWKFSGGAANTLSFMRAMYHGAGKGGQELVDRVFQNLKQP